MLKSFVLPLLPHHLIAKFYGFLSTIESPLIKNYLIHTFIKRFNVNLKESIIESPDGFKNFQEFFSRHLKPKMRSWTFDSNKLLSPVDGTVSQLGPIQKNSLLQAKGHFYSLPALLGDGPKTTALAPLFSSGSFMTLYLSPKDYHRVHMPLDGQLIQTRYIPGRLFPVNPWSVENVDNVFTRNERLILLFNTIHGPMAVIMVGAFIVGNIVTPWDRTTVPKARGQVEEKNFSTALEFMQGDDIAHFNIGSTVILLLPSADALTISPKPNQIIQLGETLGIFGK